MGPDRGQKRKRHDNKPIIVLSLPLATVNDEAEANEGAQIEGCSGRGPVLRAQRFALYNRTCFQPHSLVVVDFFILSSLRKPVRTF